MGWILPGVVAGVDEPPNAKETARELMVRKAREGSEAYGTSPFSALSRDYFSRFSRDPDARPGRNEVLIDGTWKIVLAADAKPLTELMAGHLVEFLKGAMGVEVPIEKRPAGELGGDIRKAIVLRDLGGGATDTPESFTISVEQDAVTVHGHDAPGLRDGIARLVDLMGLRQAPILKMGRQVYKPRSKVRLGTVPWLGSLRDLVFMGFNATWVTGGDLYRLSTSDAILELKDRQKPGSLDALAKSVEAARRYGLKTYSHVHTKQKFPKDHPVFKAHPDMRGALTWKADGEYVLCTEHPVVRRFLTESIADLFKAAPELDGIVIIIGGEGFYHCYMRSFGTPKGRTNCKRCDKLGADIVVANLCNALAETARKFNPDAEVIAWPYSAEHVWSADRAQSGLIARLAPGTGIFTEIEKDEYVAKPDGVNKHLWDYSIDLIGPGQRAKDQVAACRAAGIPIYMKSEPELGFEAPRLPHIPCMDRWADRANALVECGADGAWVFPAFRPCYGTIAAEVSKFFWWDPAPEKEELLQEFAARIAGDKAGPHVRQAWKHVSDAIAWSPELPSYYRGPYYLGPAQPMCADPDAKVPDTFYGYYFFMAEIDDAEGMKKRPTFYTSPTGGDKVAAFGRFYRRMEELLKRALDEIEQAAPLVAERHRLTFEAEASPVRWFYHTARTEANFYESCQFRDRLLALAAKDSRTLAETAEARDAYRQWRAVLLDEKANATEALPVMEADVRLNFRYGGDHSFADGATMIRAKLELLDRELGEFLPSVARRCSLESSGEAGATE